MLTDRFEAWWPTNPARLLLSAEAKEVARRVWHAARADMVIEMQEAVLQAPNPTFKQMSDALWVSQLGVIEPEPLQREMWESVTAFEQRFAAARGVAPACTNSDSWNCKYCNKTATCAALAAQGTPPVKENPC